MSRARWVAAAFAACAALLAIVPVATTASSAIESADERRFPHAKHTGLFPSCNGCHGGILADSASVPLMGASGTTLYPEPAQCAGCHDGTREKRVDWDGPRRSPSNLRFSHAVHNREADLGDPELNCGECHRQRGATAFMAVAQARAQPCIACHGHPAPSHLAETAPCRTCHVPVTAATALTEEQVREFPRPPSHREPGFVLDHAPTVAVAGQRCAVCHARESCERCHANAAAVPQIAALGRDARIARLVATLAPEYPLPATHRRPEWPYAHGGDARASAARCASCHTQPGCRACHTGRLGAEVIARLPAGTDTTRGVRLRGHDPDRVTPTTPHGPSPAAGDVLLQAARIQPDTGRRDTARVVRVHPPGFATRHGPAASAERVSCSGCHDARRFCTDCHEGEGRRRFHPANFAARHPADAYARRQECSSCHSREGFCAACHQRLGLASEGRRDVAYHTAQPVWLLQHGRAARQSLESCTSCHVQRDCMQCHSEAGWSVNPHGPGFDPRRVASRNAQTCRACHIGDPLRPR